MSDYLCHDFKTPRTDTSRRLPSTFRFIPVMFYIAVVGSAYMMTMDYFDFKKAQQQKKDADARKSTLDAERDAFQKELAGLEAESKKADGVAQWMEGARNLQPILVKIARAVQMETRLGAVSLERSEQAPANIALSMKVTGANAATEIAAIQNALGQLQYRAYSPQQSKTEDVIEYRSTVVRDTQ
ncbi:MAG: hypothetical protein JNG86_21730 [Verrucomicrobiaceae bacterium]|nr:hypothetical protein [Verrucomicrobiaceae bacterium]